jgi:hypothetical protein
MQPKGARHCFGLLYMDMRAPTASIKSSVHSSIESTSLCRPLDTQYNPLIPPELG